MNTYNTKTSWTRKLAIGVLTLTIAGGALEMVAGSMKNPDPEAMAVRQQVLAAQSERAYQIRTLESGQVQVAVVAGKGGF
jgi:hypothetical protein